MNIIYLNCRKYELDRKKIIAVIVVKRKAKATKVVSITVMIFFLSNSYFPQFKYMIFIYSFFHLYLSRVYKEPTKLPAPSWLIGSVGKSAAPASQKSQVRILYKPDFFSGFLFTTAKVVSITVMIFFLSNSYFLQFKYMIFIYSFFHLYLSRVYKEPNK